MGKRWTGFVIVVIAVTLGFVFWWRPAQAQAPAAEEAPPPNAPLASPDGKSSAIESLTWPVAGNNLVAMREQVKALIGQVSGAVLVKENAGLLIISLPTKELAALRQELNKTGSVNAAETESQPSAPTTLLRLIFIQP